MKMKMKKKRIYVVPIKDTKNAHNKAGRKLLRNFAERDYIDILLRGNFVLISHTTSCPLILSLYK